MLVPRLVLKKSPRPLSKKVGYKNHNLRSRREMICTSFFAQQLFSAIPKLKYECVRESKLYDNFLFFKIKNLYLHKNISLVTKNETPQIIPCVALKYF